MLVGKAPQLSILVIQNDNVQVMPAGDLYQMDTYSTEYSLWARFGDKYRMLIIGPAGENMVADAIIQGDDHNATGIDGFGGVMGSKNMKTIVVRGTLDSPQIYNVPELMDLRLQEADLMAPNPGVGAAAGSEIELAGKSGLARVGVAGCFGCQQPCGYSIKYHGRQVGRHGLHQVRRVHLQPGRARADRRVRGPQPLYPRGAAGPSGPLGPAVPSPATTTAPKPSRRPSTVYGCSSARFWRARATPATTTCCATRSLRSTAATATT